MVGGGVEKGGSIGGVLVRREGVVGDKGEPGGGGGGMGEGEGMGGMGL